jgi:hypothetical protein
LTFTVTFYTLWIIQVIKEVEILMYEVLSPCGEPTTDMVYVAPRLSDLRGKTVCEVANEGFKSEVVLPIIRELLQKHYPDIKVIPYTEFPIQKLIGSTATGAQELADTTVAMAIEKGCDAVITGIGG